MKIKTHIIRLRNRHTFRIAHGSRKEQDTFVIELQEGNWVGYGEATPVPYYGLKAEDLRDVIEKNKNYIESYPFVLDDNFPEQFWAYMQPLLGENHFAQCALDIAVHDLWARKQQKPLYKIWGFNRPQMPISNYTVGINDDVATMVKHLKEVESPIYKIKLGTKDDIAIVKELRKHTQAIFRIDANGAWTAQEAIRNAQVFKELGVEFIEQPLPAQDIDQMKEVFQKSPLPLIADESCVTEEDVDKCEGYFHGINIKLAKCGGFTPARRMITNARSKGMKVMCGCMTETSIGISAIGQLLPYLDYVDMDGSILIMNDPAEGVYLNNGKAIFPKRNGIGARWKKNKNLFIDFSTIL